MPDNLLPYLTNNEASDDLCGIINQAIQDRASLLILSFGNDTMKVEYQIDSINYEFAIDKYVKDYEMPHVVEALQSELENWLSESTIEGTDCRWCKPSNNPGNHTDRVELRLDQTKPVIGLELIRIRTLNDAAYLLRFEYS